jgi:hypothetical protein
MLPSAFPIRYLLNPRPEILPDYGPVQAAVLNPAAHEDAFREIASWDGYAHTPLRKLEGMARALGIGNLWYKDEGTRFGLGSFKALGEIYGVFRVLQEFLERKTGAAGWPHGAGCSILGAGPCRTSRLRKRQPRIGVRVRGTRINEGEP